MKTRKILHLMTLVSMLLVATACQQEDDPTVGKAKVTFVAELPDLPEHLDSRAIGDGDYANELFLWVYDDEGREIPGLRQNNVNFRGKYAYVTVYLTPGHTYGFAFWAQHKGLLSYVPGNSLIEMYYDVNCNDETRDAFWNWIPNLAVNEAGEITQNIVLVRRLSQVNCGITLLAYQEAKRAGVDLRDYDSELILESNSAAPIAYNWFNVVDGQPVTNDWDRMTWEMDFAESPMPNEPLRVGNDSYMYLALSYFQPLVDSFTLGNATLVLHHKLGLKPDITYTWPNSRFKGNYRTNLLIRSLAEDVKFDVIIDQNFANQENNVDTDGNPL
jgi:hypothetical protein